MTSDDPLGLASGTVRVVPYDPRWPSLYEAETARLGHALDRARLRLVLEHTGSTAVPGLAAKPIIDILGGRDAETPREWVIESLELAGYTYRGEQGILGRDFFRRGDPRSYHLHVTEVGSDFWDAHRLFRDYLRLHADAAREYGNLKDSLARRFPNDREAYIDGKTAFVERILELARQAAERANPRASRRADPRDSTAGRE